MEGRKGREEGLKGEGIGEVRWERGRVVVALGRRVGRRRDLTTIEIPDEFVALRQDLFQALHLGHSQVVSTIHLLEEHCVAHHILGLPRDRPKHDQPLVLLQLVS